eukprot:scaffold68662_cov37-Prasinocladus_malaysianus.AAC.1
MSKPELVGRAANGTAVHAAPASKPTELRISKPPVDFSPRLRGIWRFTDLYYLGNFLLIISYVFARNYVIYSANFSYARVLVSQADLLSWEKQAFSVFGVVMAVKAYKALSLDMFFSDFFLYAKAVLFALSYASDWRICCYYVIAFVLMFLVAQQPCYTGPDNIKYFTPGTFKWDVQENHKGVTWLVELYAPWSPPCIHLEPVFADLSLKYTNERFKFGKLDVGRWPQIGPELRVDVNGATEQLPTIIMFEAGEEIGRIPHVFSDGSFAKGKFRRSDIVRAFDLENQYARTLKGESFKSSQKAKSGKEKRNAMPQPAMLAVQYISAQAMDHAGERLSESFPSA